ncbi:hypothetical protein PHAVU_003G278100 [Phaseolus vulgaris]|uniref:Uncharacterized protein n=1 Tax=Phaseolus vulgaris TaxID=3885 RepID=V7CDS4_PHAVU|nr:hypothetical protein PHAVU_003G278100g [Phaseolus vulgaris]ESW28332.1 hypothetical protein PHAVU_003G278100g [Phaseolus vulgaris]
MAHKTIMLTFLFFLVLQHDFVLLTASRKNIQIQAPPAIPRTPQHLQWHTTNKEGVSGDAFRPTSPGHSPGVGHDTPPTQA